MKTMVGPIPVPCGNVIGVIPGVDMLMAIYYFAYDQAIRTNKDEKFGNGISDSVAASEAVKNAGMSSSMFFLLLLGVPEISTWARYSQK